MTTFSYLIVSICVDYSECFFCPFRLASCEFDLEGMDSSWNSSQWLDVGLDKKDDVEEEPGIPQYDGPADDKAGKCTVLQCPHEHVNNCALLQL